MSALKNLDLLPKTKILTIKLMIYLIYRNFFSLIFQLSWMKSIISVMQVLFEETLLVIKCLNFAFS